jgi:hypothetical protein
MILQWYLKLEGWEILSLIPLVTMSPPSDHTNPIPQQDKTAPSHPQNADNNPEPARENTTTNVPVKAVRRKCMHESVTCHHPFMLLPPIHPLSNIESCLQPGGGRRPPSPVRYTYRERRSNYPIHRSALPFPRYPIYRKWRRSSRHRHQQWQLIYSPYGQERRGYKIHGC